MNDLQEQIDRLKFQLRELATSLPYESNSLGIFFIEQDWGEEEWEAVVDVFDRYDALLMDGGEFITGQFEKAIGDAVGLSYQGVKALASTLYSSGRWELVCYHYAKSMEPHPPIEVKRIIKEYEERYSAN